MFAILIGFASYIVLMLVLTLVIVATLSLARMLGGTTSARRNAAESAQRRQTVLPRAHARH